MPPTHEQPQPQQCPQPTPAAPPPKQQLASTPYGKVAAWLNGSYSSSRSAPTKPRSGPGPPLLTRFSSSLLWYAGLGSALHSQQHRAAGLPGQQHHPSANAGGAAAAAARPAGATHPAASKQGLPLHGQGGVTGNSSSSSSNGPASHPLTLQQIEQSMEFSTSSSSAGGAAATAPAVQAVSKGRWLAALAYACRQVLSSCCVHPRQPVSLEQQCAELLLPMHGHVAYSTETLTYAAGVDFMLCPSMPACQP
jgi:hypothetical protein